jgi:hypothetical protein
MKHGALKASWGVEVYLHKFLTSAASRPGDLFTRKERTVPTGQEAGWASRAGVEAVTKRKISTPARSQTQVFQLIM